MANSFREADRLGGTDAHNWHEYTENDNKAYFDKPDHFKRSITHQPNHSRAFDKIDFSSDSRDEGAS